MRNDIRQFVIRSICRTLEDMIARARENEIDLEMERKGSQRWRLTWRARAKSPSCQTTGLGARRVTTVVENAARCTMGCPRRGVQAASSAAELVM